MPVEEFPRNIGRKYTIPRTSFPRPPMLHKIRCTEYCCPYVRCRWTCCSKIGSSIHGVYTGHVQYIKPPQGLYTSYPFYDPFFSVKKTEPPVPLPWLVIADLWVFSGKQETQQSCQRRWRIPRLRQDQQTRNWWRPRYSSSSPMRSFRRDGSEPNRASANRISQEQRRPVPRMDDCDPAC